MTDSPKPAKHPLRLILPISLAFVGAILLVGCVYLPIPEHKVGTETDFRNLVGDEHSSRPIRPGAITRSEVVRLLGAPEYLSEDGRAIEYLIHTETGFVIYPLCFAAGGDQAGDFALLLDFDDHDVLIHTDMVHDVMQFGNFGLNNGSPKAWIMYNARGSRMLPKSTVRVMPPP